MKRACLAPSVAVALIALTVGPVLAQGRPSESSNPRGSSPGSGQGAVTRGSGGGGGNSGGGSSGRSGGGSASAPSAPSGGSSVGGGGRERAVPRSGAPERRTPSAVGRGSGGSSSTGSTGSTGDSGNGGDKRPTAIGPVREVPEYGRPRGNRPVTGAAVARSEMPFTRPEWFSVYRSAFPYGVYYPGHWGAGYFYYDPFWWGDPYSYGGYPYYGGGYYGGYSRDYSFYGDYGRLRLKVKPREAQVYVDGYFSGIVDQFDGIFQRLSLKAGGHRIEIRAEGYEPLTFEVMITPRDTVTYTGALKPR